MLCHHRTEVPPPPPPAPPSAQQLCRPSGPQGPALHGARQAAVSLAGAGSRGLRQGSLCSQAAGTGCSPQPGEWSLQSTGPRFLSLSSSSAGMVPRGPSLARLLEEPDVAASAPSRV